MKKINPNFISEPKLSEQEKQTIDKYLDKYSTLLIKRIENKLK